MDFDLLNIKPTTISRDLKGKYLLLYGQPKVGKTTFACQLPKNLLIACEKGYNALAGVKAIDIVKWTDFKKVIKQLAKEEVKKEYDSVSIDTVGILWDMCEQYICMQNNVDGLTEIAWGKGYALCKKEFETALRTITMLGYGLALVAHVDTKIEKNSKGEDVEIIGPALNKRPYAIINQLVDIIGYIALEWNEDGSTDRYIYTRRTPTVMAGSRFKYMPEKIPFGYSQLTEALANAIELSGKEDGAIIDDAPIHKTQPIKRSFEEIQEQGRELWNDLVQEDQNNVARILDIVEDIFGQRIKLSEITRGQQELFEAVIDEMKNL